LDCACTQFQEAKITKIEKIVEQDDLMRHKFEVEYCKYNCNYDMGDTTENYMYQLKTRRTHYGYDNYFNWTINREWNMWQLAWSEGSKHR
jgi:hypothetical protein